MVENLSKERRIRMTELSVLGRLNLKYKNVILEKSASEEEEKKNEGVKTVEKRRIS